MKIYQYFICLSVFLLLLSIVSLYLELYKSYKINYSKCKTCPNCGLPFSDWFWWPGKGNYCWPCYNKTGKLFVKKEGK